MRRCYEHEHEYEYILAVQWEVGTLGYGLDLLGTYRVNPRSELVLGYSHFFAGNYYRTSLNSQGLPLFSGDGDFFYTQWHDNF